MIKTALAVLMALSVSPSFAESASPMKMAEAISAQWDSYWNAKDAAGIASLFTPDGVVNFPEGPIEGQQALLQTYSERFKTESHHKVTVTKVNPGNTLQLAIGEADIDVNHDGKTIHIKAHWGATYDVQGSEVRLSTLTFNSVPPPKPAAQ